MNDLATFGLACWRGAHEGMERSHRHNEIELNFIETGAMTYFFAGVEVTVEARRLAVFWAAIPHQVIRCAAPVMCIWVTIPLGAFLAWRLPTSMTTTILNGRLLIDNAPTDSEHDARLFSHWNADLSSPIMERKQIALLEMEARLRRLALSASPETETPAVSPTEPRLQRAAGMARYIRDHASQPLDIMQIAQAVGLHPNYAMSMFKATFGVSMLEYLTQQRIAHSQRLLITTDEPVASVAHKAGFGSLSQFYVAFRRLCGQTPGQYRAGLLAFRQP